MQICLSDQAGGALITNRVASQVQGRHRRRQDQAGGALVTSFITADFQSCQGPPAGLAGKARLAVPSGQLCCLRGPGLFRRCGSARQAAASEASSLPATYRLVKMGGRATQATPSGPSTHLTGV